jgi:hypothetical protein
VYQKGLKVYLSSKPQKVLIVVGHKVKIMPCGKQGDKQGGKRVFWGLEGKRKCQATLPPDGISRNHTLFFLVIKGDFAYL